MPRLCAAGRTHARRSGEAAYAGCSNLAYALNQKDLDTGALGFDYALVGEPRTYGADLMVRF